MSISKNRFNKYISGKLFHSSFLYSSYIFSMVFAFIATILITKVLNPTEYGELKFIITYWYLLDIISAFGIFHSAGQLILHIEDSTELQELIGTISLISLTIGLILVIIIALSANFIDEIFRTKLAGDLVLLAPLIIIYPIKDALILVLQCTKRISLLAYYTFLPPFIYMVSIYFITKMGAASIKTIILLQQLPVIAITIIVFILLKPRIANVFLWLKRIISYQASYGFPVFISGIFGVATQQINRLSIVYWIDSTSIGYYSLAGQLVDPIRLIPSSVATSSFREFSTQKKISNKLFSSTIALSILAFLLIYAILGKPLYWFFSKNYVEAVAPLAYYLAISSIAQGFGDIFNRFLGAHGKGKQIKNVAYVVGSVYLLGTFIITPILGLNGAVLTSILSSLIYLILIFYFYRRVTHSDEKKENGN